MKNIKAAKIILFSLIVVVLLSTCDLFNVKPRANDNDPDSTENFSAPPSIPDNLATSSTTSSITITWDAVTAADGYRIYRSTDSSEYFTQIGTDITGVTSYTDIGLGENETYFYKVSAFNTDGESILSVGVSGVTLEIPRAGLVSEYLFVGNANDTSVNNFNGTVNGPTVTTDRFGNINSAYSFDGINDYIDLPSPNFINNYTTRAISLWFKITGTGVLYYQLDNGEVIVSILWDATNEYFYPTFGVQYESSGFTYLTAVNTVITAGEWHNLIATWEKGGNMTLYFDRVLCGSLFSLNENLRDWNYSGSIGSKRSTGGFFNGDIDDLRLYDRVLSDTEIEALFLEGN